LKSAQTDASQAEKLVSQAVQASPLVEPVTRVHIPLHALKDQIEQLIAQVIWCNQEVRFLPLTKNGTKFLLSLA
jgi:hypothetical protein